MIENQPNENAERPTEVIERLQRERDAKELQKTLSEAMKDAKTNSESKTLLFNKMNELTTLVRQSESKQLDAITAGAIQTALEVSTQLSGLGDPKLKRQAMITLQAINRNLSTIDTADKEIDLSAVKENVNVVLDSQKTDTLLQKVATSIDKNKNGTVSKILDEMGPSIGVIKDAFLAVSKKIVENKPEASNPVLRDYIIQNSEPEAQPITIPAPSPITQPVDNSPITESKPVNEQPKPEKVKLPKQPKIEFDSEGLKTELVKINQVESNILEHIISVGDTLKKQLAINEDLQESQKVKETQNGFRHVRSTPLLNPPTPAPTVDMGSSGGLLGIVSDVLFGGKGIIKGIGSFLIKVAAGALAILSPSNIAKYSKLIAGKVISIGSDIVGKFTSIFDDIGGVLGKVGKLGKIGKTIPVVGQVIAIVTGIYDFFDGFINAGEVLNKAKDKINLWDRLSAGVGSLVGGVVGIVDSVVGLFGVDLDWGDKTKKYIAEKLDMIPSKISDAFSSITDIDFTGFKDDLSKSISDNLSVVQDIFSDVVDTITNVGSTMRHLIIDNLRSTLNLLPGNLGDKLLPSVENKPSPSTDGEKPTKKNEPTFIDRAVEKTKSLGSMIYDNFTKNKEENKKFQDAVINQSSISNNQNNISSTNNNIYQSTPITTRPGDDSFRIA